MAEPLRRIAGWLIVALLIAACQPQAPVEVKPTASALADLAASTSTQPAPTATPDSMRAPLWTFQTEGAIWSSPTVSDGVVYVGSDDHRLYAVNSESGVERWRFDTGGLVRSRPAVDDGVVYFASDDGFLYAVSAESGEEVWQVDIGNAVTPRGPLTGSYDYGQSSPAVAEGLVYVGSADGNLYVRDAATGQEKWRYKANAKIRSSPVVAGGLVFVGDKTDVLYALDARTGEEEWRFRGAGDQPTPTIADGVIYVGGRSTYLYALDAQTGEVKWHFAFDGGSWVESSAAVVDDRVYVGSSDAVRLYALDRATAEKQWSTRPCPIGPGRLLPLLMAWSTSGVIRSRGPVHPILAGLAAASTQLTSTPTLRSGRS